LAHKFYKDYERDDFTVLQEKLQSTVDKILKVIDAKSNVELYETTWYEKWTLGRMIQFNTASPYTNAKARLRKWKKKNQLYLSHCNHLVLSSSAQVIYCS